MPISSKTKSAFGHWRFKVVDEAGSARTLTTDDFGTILTNSGGACTFTLPAPIPAFNGAWVKFYQIADGNVVIDCATADLLVVHNDATADSISNATAAHQIGDAYTALCSGTKWLIFCHPADEGITRTIVTA